MKKNQSYFLAFSVFILAAGISGCGATSSTGTPPIAKYAIKGNVTTLKGPLKLLNNGGDEVDLVSGDTTFTFSTQLATGAAYDVTVLSSPSTQTCAVTFDTQGPVGSADVTDIVVTCTDNGGSTPPPAVYTVGGSVAGLTTGTSVSLFDSNTSESLPISLNGNFTFKTTYNANASYNVQVATNGQPTGENCVVTSGGSGTVSGDVTTIVVTCTPTTQSALTISGTIVALDYQTSVTVTETHSGQTVTVNGNSIHNGTFSFSNFHTGDAYNIQLTTNITTVTPDTTKAAQKHCAVSSTGTPGSGTVGSSNLTVAVDCVYQLQNVTITPPAFVSAIDPTATNYKNYGLALYQAYCLSCHNGGDGTRHSDPINLALHSTAQGLADYYYPFSKATIIQHSITAHQDISNGEETNMNLLTDTNVLNQNILTQAQIDAIANYMNRTYVMGHTVSTSTLAKYPGY